MLESPVYWSALAGIVALFWILPAQVRLLFLAIAGLVTIAWFDTISVLFLIGTATAVYAALPSVASVNTRHRGWLVALTIVAIVLPLIVFKSGVVSDLLLAEARPNASDIIVPLGMSYYSFRLVHVVMEVFKHQAIPFSSKHYFSYIFLFTILPAGPIQRIDLFVATGDAPFDPDHVLHGMFRICIGLIKQVLVFDYLVQLRGEVTGPGNLSTLALEQASYGGLWAILALAYVGSLLNLSAYTDLAIGTSRLFGFTISENFNYPFIAQSLPEFWRRWHITLSSWCQTYVYSPMLGWSRNPYLALLVSFQVMGLWHAFSVNRVFWGVFQAVGVIVASLWHKKTRRNKSTWADSPFGIAVSWALTQAFVCASWIFVIAENDQDYLASLRILLKLALPMIGN